jgi:hypothetical protein
MKKHVCISVIVFAVVTLTLSLAGAHAGMTLSLVPAEKSNKKGIVVHDAPSIWAPRVGKVYTHHRFNACAVEWTGKEENGWIEIIDQHPGDDPWMNIPPLGWVFGEYFGIAVEGDFQSFGIVKYVTKGEYVKARCYPLITMGICRTYQYKGTKITIVGRKGSWLKTVDGNWVYHELLEPLKE